MVSYKRHLFKTISWRAVGTLDTIILSGVITGSWETGLAIGGVEVRSLPFNNQQYVSRRV